MTSSSASDCPTVYLELERMSRSQPDQIALSDDHRSWTYPQLCAEAEILASGLVAKAGTNEGALAVISENRPEVYGCWLAGSRSGLVPSIMNPQLTATELSKQLSKLQPVLVATVASHADRVAAGLELAHLDVPMVMIGDTLTSGQQLRYEDLMAGDPYRGPHPAGHSIFEVAWTSGTTSDPKGVALSHQGVVSHWAAVAQGLGMSPSDVAYVVTPLYHQAGMRHTTLVTWLAGGRAHLASRFSPKIYWNDIERVGATYTCLVPTMTHILRTATPDQWEANTTRRPGYCYGSTETGVPVLVPHGTPTDEIAPYLNYRAGAAFAGWPTRGCQAKIAGEADRNPQEGLEGEILVRSPGMLRRYWRDPAATDAAFSDGWFKSGDKGIRGPNGSIYFLDRLRDLVRRGGENIACREIEEVLMAHPLVEQAAVFSVPDPVWGEEAKAVVIAVHRAPIPPHIIWSWCEERLAPFKIPRFIEFRDELPVSTSGKIQKAVLRHEGVRPDRSFDRMDPSTSTVS